MSRTPIDALTHALKLGMPSQPATFGTPDRREALDPDRLAEKILSHRLLRGLTHADVGKEVGVSSLTIRRWEKGETFPRGEETRERLREFLAPPQETTATQNQDAEPDTEISADCLVIAHALQRIVQTTVRSAVREALREYLSEGGPASSVRVPPTGDQDVDSAQQGRRADERGTAGDPPPGEHTEQGRDG